MKTQNNANPKNYSVGVAVARLQGKKIHFGQRFLLDTMSENHKKTIIFLGVSRTQNDDNNPLDFITRKMMVQEMYPSAVILPITDQRYDKIWSKNLDSFIQQTFGDDSVLLYGSRDSFIPRYSGKYDTLEVKSPEELNHLNNSETRIQISKEALASEDFRHGCIYTVLNQRGNVHGTVDVCGYNDNGEILMAKKPNETLWRFVGGFIDADDESKEKAAKREFAEETGGNAVIGDLQYITSRRVDDWRYERTKSKIMTTLFLGRVGMGAGLAKASDDIAEVAWLPIREFSNYHNVRTMVIPEHRELMLELVNKVYDKNLIPNIGERLPERTEKMTYTQE